MSENQRFWVYGALAALLAAQANDEPRVLDGLVFITLSLGFFVAAGRVLLAPVFRRVFRRGRMTWGSAIHHKRDMHLLGAGSRRRCNCGCKTRATHRGDANGAWLDVIESKYDPALRKMLGGDWPTYWLSEVRSTISGCGVEKRERIPPREERCDNTPCCRPRGHEGPCSSYWIEGE